MASIVRPDNQVETHLDGQRAMARRVFQSVTASDWDYIDIAYPTATTETYTFKRGGSGGTTIQVITLTYTDSEKGSLSSVARG